MTALLDVVDGTLPGLYELGLRPTCGHCLSDLDIGEGGAARCLRCLVWWPKVADGGLSSFYGEWPRCGATREDFSLPARETRDVRHAVRVVTYTGACVLPAQHTSPCRWPHTVSHVIADTSRPPTVRRGCTCDGRASCGYCEARISRAEDERNYR